MRNYARRAAGFTLIEIMVVVAIIGIIAAIALPSYNEYVRKTRRAAGAACITAMAQQMERWYTANMTYVGATMNTTVCEDNASRFYSFATPVLGVKAYTVTATPANGHTDPTCGTLSIDQAGVTTPSTDGCW